MSHCELKWSNQTKRFITNLESIVAAEETFILVDEASFDSDVFARWLTIPFLEREREYWGPPPDDETAICELERLRRLGNRYIVFAWPAFWWLEHYTEFNRYLRSQFVCVLEDDRLVVFDLQRKMQNSGSGK